MTKRVLSMLLCLVVALSFFPAFSTEAEAASYDELSKAAAAASKMTWYWPLDKDAKYKISSGYGYRAMDFDRVHYGIDIEASKGTAVFPIQTGTVVVADNNPAGGEGRHVVIKHDQKYNKQPFYSQYFHLQTVNVKKGQIIGLDTKIGTVGGSGFQKNDYYSTHLHLQVHYESYASSNSINPCPQKNLRSGGAIKEGRPMENGKDYDGSTTKLKNCGKKFIEKKGNISCLTYNKIDRDKITYFTLCSGKTSLKNITVVTNNSMAEIRSLPCDETTLRQVEKQYKTKSLGSSNGLGTVGTGKQLAASQLIKNTKGEYWFKVHFDDQTGYISGEYVNVPSSATDSLPCAATLKVTADNTTKNKYPANDKVWSEYLGDNVKTTVAKNTADLKAVAICRNIYGNYWYQLEDGSYIPADKVKTTLAEPTMIVEGMSPNGTIPAMTSYSLSGTVSSNNMMPIASVEVSVTDSSGKEWATASDTHFTMTNRTYYYEVGNNNELSNCCNFGELPAGTYTYTVRASFLNSYSDDGKNIKTKNSTAENSIVFTVEDDAFLAILSRPELFPTDLTVTFKTPLFSNKLKIITKDGSIKEISTNTLESDAYIRYGGKEPYAYYYRVIGTDGKHYYVSADYYKSHTTNEKPSVTLKKESASEGAVTVSGSVQGPSWMSFKTAMIDSTTTCTLIKAGSFTEQLAETFKAGTYNISANATYTYRYVNAKQKLVTETVTAQKKLTFTVSAEEASQTAPTVTPTPSTPVTTPSPTPVATTENIQGSEYLEKCEIRPTYLYLTATTSNNNSVMTLPCSKGTNSNSKQVKALANGEKMTAVELVRNSVGNYWYKVVLSDGRSGYATGNLNTPATNYQPDNALTITIPDIKTHTRGKSHTVTGTVKRYAALDGMVKVTGTLYQPNGNKASSGNFSKNADSISLKSTAVDKNMKFASLNIGECKITVAATMDIPYTPDGKTLSTLSISASQTDYFTVGKTQKIKYDANGGSKAPSAQNIAYGNTVTLSRTIPVRSGFEFLGWSETKGAKTATYKAGGTFKDVRKDYTLYAVWEPKLNLGPECFPDPNFWSYVSQNYDLNGDGALSREEVSYVENIFCPEMSISSLKGIEYFTELRVLNCSGNQLTSLDVSKNTALEVLWCNYNQLKALDVSYNTELTSLLCDQNQLTSLDVSKNMAMTELWVAFNQLTSLDVSHNTALEDLYCTSNQIKTLDVSHNTELQRLICGQNQLISLDVSHNTALTYFLCSSNQLTSLDVSYNTALKEFRCDFNQLTSLDVSHNTELRDYFDCGYNQLTSLDVSHNTELTNLICDGNQLTSLDVSHNTALTQLGCGQNQLTSLDVSHNTALEYFTCYGNQLTSLDLSNNQALKHLLCSYNLRTVTTESNRLDLSTLPGFDISRASNWEGGTLDGSILTFNSDRVTYTYDLRNGNFENPTFTLISTTMIETEEEEQLDASAVSMEELTAAESNAENGDGLPGEIPAEQVTEDQAEAIPAEQLPNNQPEAELEEVPSETEQSEQPAEEQEAGGDPEGNNAEPVEAAPVEQASEDPAEAEESADNEADEEPAGIEQTAPEETGENVREEQEAVQAEA